MGESDECVSELRVPQGAGRIRPAVALGSLFLSLPLFLLANMFREREREGQMLQAKCFIFHLLGLVTFALSCFPFSQTLTKSFLSTVALKSI